MASDDISKPDSVPDIAHVRVEIDRVDTMLLSLIAERLELAGAVRRAKSGARVWRPSREESHVRDLSDVARDASPELVSRIWAELMSASLALQGPMRLYIALEGDRAEVMTMVRDRFGAALPTKSYPTASSALAAAYGEDEGVAVLPSPGGMNSWWAALCPGGAMPDMYIHAGLPRTGNADWPRAVAVATADLAPSGADQTLIVVKQAVALGDLKGASVLRGQAGQYSLYSVDGFIDAERFAVMASKDASAKIIGLLPRPLGLTT